MLPQPSYLPNALPQTDSGALLARALAPTLYLQSDEKFPLLRVVAILHPDLPIIAYHLLWSDDVHGAWLPFTNATDQEVVWVGYDSTLAPTDLWSYWHGTILHADWRGRGQVLVDVQWGKHGSLPRGASKFDPAIVESLGSFYTLTWFVPDYWLGNIIRSGPWCFCHSFARYLEFTRQLSLAGRIDAVARTADADAVLTRVFGRRYSRKPEWPVGLGGRDS